MTQQTTLAHSRFAVAHDLAVRLRAAGITGCPDAMMIMAMALGLYMEAETDECPDLHPLTDALARMAQDALVTMRAARAMEPGHG